MAKIVNFNQKNIFRKAASDGNFFVGFCTFFGYFTPKNDVFRATFSLPPTVKK